MRCLAPLVVFAALQACQDPGTATGDAGLVGQIDAASGQDAMPSADAGPGNRPDCQLQMSASSDRTNPMPVGGVPPVPTYVFLNCSEFVPTQVGFWLNDPLSSPALNVEVSPPFDMMGSTDDIPDPLVKDNYLSDIYTVSAVAQSDATPETLFIFTGELNMTGAGDARWMVSDFPDRRNPRVLAGETLTANAYIHLHPGYHKRGEFDDVRNYIDGVFVEEQDDPPYDLLGGSDTGPADALDPALYTSGVHQIEARVDTATGPRIFVANFSVL